MESISTIPRVRLSQLTGRYRSEWERCSNRPRPSGRRWISSDLKWKPRKGSNFLVHAATQREKPPSYRTSLSELEALERLSVIVPDSQLGYFDESPAAASAGSAALCNLMKGGSDMREVEGMIIAALSSGGCKQQNEDEKFACFADKAVVNIGSSFARRVAGKITTEVDPTQATHAEAMVENARRLIGIQAVKILEQEGIQCLVHLVGSFIQVAAAAQSGASVIQISVGRVRDWYRKHPGAIRDPTGPREDSGFQSKYDPGLALVKKAFDYTRCFHPKTKIMASGIRNKADALNCAGCDFIVLGDKVLKDLASVDTAAGYNDSLSITNGAIRFESVEPTMSADLASEDGFKEWEKEAIDMEMFEARMDAVGKDLLVQGVKSLAASRAELVSIMKKRWPPPNV